MDPFTGHWVANLEKSQRHLNHQFHSATRRFEVWGGDIPLTQSVLD